jgi:glycosyltransferase involved in cell wall biosynthesis
MSREADMSKILTFIIPSYNVEDYLPKCMDSFLNMSILDQLEVIIVDDGSHDGTAEIARSYVKQYPDIYCLHQKTNGGHGSTINVGSKIARGKYFKVVDADDWVMTENLPAFIRYLERCEADVVLTPFHMVDMNSGEKIIQRMYIQDHSQFYTPDEIARDWKLFDQCTTFHGITYCTKFYNQHKHRLTEHVFYEDQEYATIPFCCAKEISLFDLSIYQYMVGNSMQSVAIQNQIKRIGQLEKVIFAIIKYRENMAEICNFSELYWQRKTEAVILSYYTTLCISNPDKISGRRLCAIFNRRLKEKYPAIYSKIKRVYYIYVLFSLLRISPYRYDKIIHTSIFRLLRHNHKIERES